MIPLKPLASWRKGAQDFRPAEFGFAMGAVFCDALKMRGLQASDCGAPNCDPFPSTWPDPVSYTHLDVYKRQVMGED